MQDKIEAMEVEETKINQEHELDLSPELGEELKNNIESPSIKKKQTCKLLTKNLAKNFHYHHNKFINYHNTFHHSLS